MILPGGERFPDDDTGSEADARGLFLPATEHEVVMRHGVVAGVNDFVTRTGADELMVTGQIFDPAARKRSFEILAQEVVNAG